ASVLAVRRASVLDCKALLDTHELAAEADLGGGTAVEVPAILIPLLEARVVGFLGLGMRDLAVPGAVLGHELGSEQVHADIFRSGNDLRASAIALTGAHFDGEVLPTPFAKHVLQRGCRCRSAGQHHKDDEGLRQLYLAHDDLTGTLRMKLTSLCASRFPHGWRSQKAPGERWS